MEEPTTTYRLSRALPPRLVAEGDCLELRAGVFSGCMPVAYIFFALGLFMVWAGVQMALQGIERLYIYWGGLVLPTLGFAFWLFGRRVRWRLGRHVIQRREGYRLTTQKEWPAEAVRGVEVVQQFHDARRFSQLAPGVHLLTESGDRIDLGAHGDPERVREIGRAVADFYSVPFEQRARDEVFRHFRRHKLIILLVALAVVALVILARELF